MLSFKHVESVDMIFYDFSWVGLPLNGRDWKISIQRSAKTEYFSCKRAKITWPKQMQKEHAYTRQPEHVAFYQHNYQMSFYFFVDCSLSLSVCRKFIMYCLNSSKFKRINQSGHIYIHIRSNRRMWMKIKTQTAPKFDGSSACRNANE